MPPPNSDAQFDCPGSRPGRAPKVKCCYAKKSFAGKPGRSRPRSRMWPLKSEQSDDIAILRQISARPRQQHCDSDIRQISEPIGPHLETGLNNADHWSE